MASDRGDEAMICPHCGQEIQGQALFCPNCGQKLHGAAQASMRPAPIDASAPQAEGRGCTQSLIVLTVALIVVLAIIGVGVLAVYYGLADRAKVEQQVAEDHYGKGLAHLDRGELELAVAEFELVLQLAPKHQAAQDRLREARQALEAQPTATPMLLEETKAARFEELRQAHAAGDWDAVLEAADRLLALDSAYRRDDVNRMLFDAFYQSGQELLAQDRMKEAVGRFDYALALQPDNVQLAHARKLASLYMAGMGYWGADWARAIEQLSALYTLAPDYRDVRQRVYDAHLIYGDMLAQNQDWCRAAEQYAAALGVSMDAAA
ncbi:MAG: zinc-ribbon domain-containing protein, partial [Chloroflexi bacterium]|nr:zinc-ribbon domain-containing protein [Chloroflexota bacterium]